MRFLLCLLLLFSLALPGLAAPLLSDIPDEHWAKDAVAALVAKGLVEGYPDATFKGDRAVSRWELALVVARLLARMESAHATFASRADLEDLRKLTDALSEELDAMGVRVTNLEESVGLLDRRVTELERISFYGEVITNVASHNLWNTGSPGTSAGVPLINYDTAVGTDEGGGGLLQVGQMQANLPTPNPLGVPLPPLPFDLLGFGVSTVSDWSRGGIPLVEGASFTSLARLGLTARLTDDLEAGAEFAAYSSQGNSSLDRYYGVTAPYLSNFFTSNQSIRDGGQSQNHFPFTRATLDHFWIRHKPSKTQLVLGAYGSTRFDSILYRGQPNPGVFAPLVLPNYGLQVQGQLPLSDDMVFDWEVMGTRLADGNVPASGGDGYFSHAEGATVGLTFHDKRGRARLGVLHAADDASNGAALAVGERLSPFLANTRPWVNPPEFWINNLGGLGHPQVAGIGSTSDVRPVPTLNFGPLAQALGFPMFDGSLAGVPLPVPNAHVGLPNLGGVGPQGQTGFNIGFDYRFDNEFSPRIAAEYARTRYRPNRNSSYEAEGDALRVGLGADFFDKKVAVDLDFISVDPRYSPYILQWPQVNGNPAVTFSARDTLAFNYSTPIYALHDTGQYPHNREGFRAKVKWKFSRTGAAGFEYQNLNQTSTSLQDIRASHLSQGNIGNVLGFAPGFVDAVFHDFHPATFAPSGGNLFAVPLENPRGNVEVIKIGGGHKWLFDPSKGPRGIAINGGYRRLHFTRDSNLSSIVPGPAGIMGEHQNNIDFVFQGFGLGVAYDLSDTFTLKGDYAQVFGKGHFDPLASYVSQAVATGNTELEITNFTTAFPSLGFEWKMEENLQWDFQAQYMANVDKVSAGIVPEPAFLKANVVFAPQPGTHPFSWSGLRLNSSLRLKF